MNLDSLPTGYQQPEKLIIASNSLINVQAIIEINGSLPILIGDGKKPRIWLYIPANKEGTEWYPLVKDNFSTNKDVLLMGKSNSVVIATPQGNVLECEKKSSGEIEVTKLDLRPFGIDFLAAGNAISIMGNTFSSNSFVNARVMFGVGSA